MKKICAVLALIVLSIFSNAQTGWRPGEMEIKVFFNGPDKATVLQAMQVNGDIYLHAGYAICYLTAEELELVDEQGFRYEIIKDDLRSFAAGFWQDRDAYHSYEEIIQAINVLCFSHPLICKRVDFGYSVEGRQLVSLKISDNVHTDEAEPEVMFDGGIHGDEIGGPENLIRFAEDLCADYGSDPYITELIDTREIWLYIMVNPDGRVNMVRYNSNGVDLNRDWGYMWNGEGNSPSYYSQIETRALRDCMYSNQFVVHTTYHSGTEYLSYPWSYRPEPCPDNDHIDYLATIYANQSGYSNLPYGQGYTGMYAINGSSKDAYYAVAGSIGWTMEISMDKQPPASQIVYYYEANKPSMLAIIESAGSGIHGQISDAETGEPVMAAIFIDDFYPAYSDPEIGDYHKYLLPGTYTVRATANGYEPSEQQVTIPSAGSATLNFNLQPGEFHYGYKIAACQIPDTNFADEALTYAALGGPDQVNYSIGKSGWVIIDMGIPVLDGPGSEIRVIEGDQGPEGYLVFAGATQDGPWITLGNGNGSTLFDFTDAGIDEARFIRLVDDGDGPLNGNDAGFDLDAVEAVAQPLVIALVPDCRVNDFAGNQNGRLDPGETCELIISLRNHGGLTAQGLSVQMNYDTAEVFLPVTAASAGNLAHGQETEMIFPVECSPSANAGSIVMMVLNVTANDGSFNQSFPMHLVISGIAEDWESGGFTQFAWESQGNKPWVINFLNPYEGSYSAKSGVISDGQSSSLIITLDVIGYDDISFYRKVSSQEGSDFLKFFVDDMLVDQWSGNKPWESVTYDIKPGLRTFRWTYQKDGAFSQGFDAGYLDYIVFPSSNISGELKVLANALPHEHCGPGASQLGAYTTGGSGNFIFEWTPEGPLNDPGSGFPVANLAETTDFSVNVIDGTTNVTDAILVSVFEMPGLPVVSQQGDSLLSSAAEGNQWYSSSGLIEGATGQVFYPEAEDYYHVIVTSGPGCISEPSEPVYFLFTGLKEAPGISSFRAWPTPAREELFIEAGKLLAGDHNILLLNTAGQPIAGPWAVNPGINRFPVGELVPGIYFIKIINNSGSSVYTGKLIR